jgi:NADPH:quinone reductase-like Zn-dependent oxidoreductase
MLLGSVISQTGGKTMGVLALEPNKDLAYIGELLESGKIASFIDRRYPLSEVPEALRYFGSGQFCGKIVITVKS